MATPDLPRRRLLLSPASLGAAGLACLLFWGAVPPAWAQGGAAGETDLPGGLAAALEQQFVDAIERAELSVVAIARDNGRRRLNEIEEFEGFGRPGGGLEVPGIANPAYVPNDFGTGIVIRKDGLILTTYHLVRGGPIVGKPAASDQVLYVRLPDRRGFPARILAADPRSDLAVLKIEVNDLRPVRFANGARVRKGQFVIALGNPYAIARDGSPSASWGIVSNISRTAALEGDPRDEESLKRETIHHLGTLLQIDSRVELGSSGGPLLNLRGEVIGLTTSLAAVLGYEKTAGFAVPFDEAMLRVVDTLMRGEEVEYGFLGVTPADLSPDRLADVARRFDQYGAAVVRSVIPNSPAAQASMQDNDIVLTVNDRRVLSRVDLTREVGLLAPGTVAQIRVWRDREGVDRTLAVKVGKWPVSDDEGIVATRRRFEPWRGLVVDHATARRRFFPVLQPLRGRELLSGVLIVELEPGSPAEAADLHPGDMITHVRGMPVQSPQEFDAVVRDLKGEVPIALAGGRQVVLSP